MLNLIDAFDSYKDFERLPFFTVCYHVIPSNLFMDIPLEGSKDNMEMVLGMIDFNAMDMELVFKNWKTEDYKDADFSKDYPFEYLFKGKQRKILLWISLVNNELYVDYLYDVSDKELEEWIIHTNHLFRTKLGMHKTASFKILTKKNAEFVTKEVKTDNVELDLERLYNDDFLSVNEVIQDALGTDKSGLILLYGLSGAGKTSYIKSLMTSHDEKAFIFIQNEFIKELLNPDFISFLISNRNAVIVIEDAEKVITSRESFNEHSVVSTILQLTDGLFSDFLNIKIICTFNTNIDKIDTALLRKGRMIANYEFKALSKDKVKVLMDSLGFEPRDEEMTLADIFNYDKKSFEHEQKVKKIGFFS